MNQDEPASACVQGYLFSPPVGAAAVAVPLEAQRGTLRSRERGE